MTRLIASLLLLLIFLPSHAGASQCLVQAEATPYQFQFDSGASWQLCWHVDRQVGLVISDVFYGAPSEQPRQLLDSASIGQILFKYDEDTSASHLASDPGLGGEQFDSASVEDCIDGELIAGVDSAQLCQRYRDLNHLIKVRRTESIRRHEVSLHARAVVGAHQFEQVWRFSEDGELTPSVLFTGSISRYTSDARYGVKLGDDVSYASSAVILVNWRLDFNIDGTPTNDLVDEIEFIPVGSDKRKISITHLDSEAARTADIENFRGWRISDAEVSSGEGHGESATTRVGYYLDPQVAGLRYVSPEHSWTSFDFFVTKNDACEKLSSSNISSTCAESHHSPGADSHHADSLDEFADNEPLSHADVVVWFSVSRQFIPQMQDYPAIATRETGFKLIPFDWSASSPFESLPAGDDIVGTD